MSHPEAAAAVAFVRVLRRSGLRVSTGATVVYARALAAVGVDRPEAVYWAGRATLVRRPEDVGLYDRAFAGFFGQVPADLSRPPVRPVELLLDADDGGGDPDEVGEGDEHDVRVVRWSTVEVLKDKDLAACTPDELDEAHRLMADLRMHAALRRSRRRRRDPHDRGRPDLRRSLRRAMRTGGEVLRPATTRPADRPRRLLLLLDVSGSMEPYARALARFAHAAVAARRQGQVEVFALGTRVTRITRELSSHDPDEALARASDAVADWAGGTRLGAGLRRFNDRWGVRGLARGAVVAVLSDGWDRGDPEALEAEMARLHRVAHRIVWVNPLKASPGYAPVARGMAAALPHVDEFVEGHSVASLEALAEVVAR
ncbi:MAG: vWA domain-containing protein [Acidimicrobiales bacterium]